MKQTEAQENIKLIREVMERSAKYTHFSGLSGVLSGIVALLGCTASVKVYLGVSPKGQNPWYIAIWSTVLVIAIAEDLILAQTKARRNGQTIWGAPLYQILKAVFPGVFVAAVISAVALYDGALDAIPAIWALGYGAALCAAGMFSIKEVWVYGVVQLITGTIGLCWLNYPPYSLYLLATSFGAYQVLFGLWVTRKYRC